MLPSAGNTLPALLIAVLVALAAAVCAWGARRVSLRDSRVPSRLAWALAGVYFAVFLTLALTRFYNLGYWCTDLGEYGNLAYNTGHGKYFVHSYLGFDVRFAHCAPLLFLLALLAYIFPEPVYVVVIVVAASAAIIPLLYYLGAARGARWGALALAASYAFSTYIHSATLYENPFRPAGAALLLGGLLLFVRRRFAWGVVCTALAAAASEEMAVYAVVVAALSIWLSRRRLAGIIFMAAMAVYAGAVCFYLYPKLALGYPVMPNLWSYVARFREVGWSTLAEAKGVIPFNNRLWYFITALGPVAWFLPFAGAGVATLAVPAAVFATHENASIVRHGFGFSFQFIPFAYAAAAFGLHRLNTWRRVSGRRFFLVAGSVSAVVFQIALISLAYRSWYVSVYRDVFPSYHRLGTLAGIRNIPPGVSLSVDQPAFALVAHRPVATLFPHGLGLGALPPVEGVFLDRDLHCALVMPSDMARLRAAGFYPAEVARDYAYFTRTPGKYSYDDVWEAWYGVISESHFCAPGRYRRPLRDSRALHDGVVRRFERTGFLLGRDRYFFPPGRYKFIYILACDKDAFCHVITRLTFHNPRTGAVRRSIKKCWTLNRDGEYHGYIFKFRIKKPSVVAIDLTGAPSYFFDDVVVEGEGYNLKAVARYCPWPYMPRAGPMDDFK